MSPLLRNELSIVLSPKQIGMLCTERKLTLRGYQRCVQARKVVACEEDSGGEMPWSSAIATLETALPSIVKRNMEVNIVLANHFMRYALVPWIDRLSDGEEMALAKHCFRDAYGTAADSMHVRISPGRPGAAVLASAVDTGLLDELRGLTRRMRLELKSIQPHLMVAYNSCRDRLEGRSAWVALIEPDNVCLAALQKGQLAWVRKMRIGSEWNEELPMLLEREAYLADANVAMDEVFLWAPHLDDIEAARGWPWKVQHLKPGAQFA